MTRNNLISFGGYRDTGSLRCFVWLALLAAPVGAQASPPASSADELVPLLRQPWNGAPLCDAGPEDAHSTAPDAVTNPLQLLDAIAELPTPLLRLVESSPCAQTLRGMRDAAPGSFTLAGADLQTALCASGLALVSIHALQTLVVAQDQQLDTQGRKLQEQVAAIAWHDERVAELEMKMERLEAITNQLLGATLHATIVAATAPAAESGEAVVAALQLPKLPRIVRNLQPVGPSPAGGQTASGSVSRRPEIGSRDKAVVTGNGPVRQASDETTSIQIVGVRQVDSKVQTAQPAPK